jgi:hypothetical protein
MSVQNLIRAEGVLSKSKFLKTFQAVRGSLSNCPLLWSNAEVLSFYEAQ